MVKALTVSVVNGQTAFQSSYLWLQLWLEWPLSEHVDVDNIQGILDPELCTCTYVSHSAMQK